MARDANSHADDTGPADDTARFREISEALADAVEAVLPGWIQRLVLLRVEEWRGEVDAGTVSAAAAAGQEAREAAMPRLRALLGTDIDEQRDNPLSVLRDATRFPHRVLADVGMPEIVRDDFAERSFPDDVFGLVPATWGDVDPSLHEIGITWGAAKAFVHKARRRAEGRGGVAT